MSREKTPVLGLTIAAIPEPRWTWRRGFHLVGGVILAGAVLWWALGSPSFPEFAALAVLGVVLTFATWGRP